MDTQSLTAALTILSTAITSLKNMKELLPKGTHRDHADRLLIEAEQKLKEAEARLATELGFPLCKRCWPPEIMTEDDEGLYVCRKCGKPSHPINLPTITPENPSFGDSGNW